MKDKHRTDQLEAAINAAAVALADAITVLTDPALVTTPDPEEMKARAELIGSLSAALLNTTRS